MWNAADFARLPVHKLLGWPTTIVLVAGILSIAACGLGLLYWALSHLQWVQ